MKAAKMTVMRHGNNNDFFNPATGRIPDNIRTLELGFASGLPNDLADENRKQMSNIPSWTMRGPWNVGGRTESFCSRCE